MIIREQHGPVTVARLQHGKASALDVELCDAIHTTFTELRDADAVVLTGTESIFSAGVDLLRLLEEGEAYTREFLPALHRAFTALFCFPRPVVAATNGHAIAGGCVLVAACDYRVMASGKGRIGVPELLVGVPFPLLALEAMRFAVPAQHLQEIVYTGRSYLPEEAQARGLVDEVVDADAVLERSVALATKFAGIPKESFELAKSQLRRPTMDFVGKHEANHDRTVEEVWCREETRQTIQAYMDAIASKRR
ncbi:MAG: enoyl-CoA hydratase/isomerase family protein [Planctomycetota bacterium]